MITDASTTGIGCTIMTGPPNMLRPWGFSSRKLSPTEQKYGIPDLEALAVGEACEKYYDLLRHCDVIIQVDHLNLTFYAEHTRKGSKSPRSMRIARVFDSIFHQLQLRAKMTHIDGKDNISDAMSRLAASDGEEEEETKRRVIQAYIDGTSAQAVQTARQAHHEYQRIKESVKTVPASQRNLTSAAPSSTGTGTRRQHHTGAASLLTVAAVAGINVTSPSPLDFDVNYELAQAVYAHSSSQHNPIATGDWDGLMGIPASAIAAATVATRSEVAAFTPVLQHGLEFIRLLSEALTATPPSADNVRRLKLYKTQRFDLDVWAMRDIDGVERLYIPPDTASYRLRELLLHIAHACNGHFAKVRTVQAVRDNHVTWPGFTAHVADHVKSCVNCDRFAATGKLPHGLMNQITATRPLELVEMDFVGPLPTTAAGNVHICVTHEKFTRRTVLFPTKDKTAESALSALANFYGTYGLPATIIHDGDQNFVSKAVSWLLERIGVGNFTAAPYHPQTNGGNERSHGTSGAVLRKLAQLHPDLWDTYIPIVQCAMNAAVNRSIGVSPDRAVFTFVPVSVGNILAPATFDSSVEIPASAQALATAFSAVGKTLFEEISSATARSNELYKNYFERRHSDVSFDNGQMVWVHYPPSSSRGDGKLTTVNGSGWRLGKIIGPAGRGFFTVQDYVMLEQSKVALERLRPCYAKLTEEEAILESAAPDTWIPERVITHKVSTSTTSSSSTSGPAWTNPITPGSLSTARTWRATRPRSARLVSSRRTATCTSCAYQRPSW